MGYARPDPTSAASRRPQPRVADAAVVVPTRASGSSGGRPARHFTQTTVTHTEEAAYHEVCAYTLSRGDTSFVHQHVVDAWAVQHATPATKPIRICFALVGLYLHVEHGWTGRAVQNAHMRLATQPERWPTGSLPAARGTLTAIDVLAASAGPERDAAISRWAANVWEAVASNRRTMDELLRRRGIL